ncbi:MULTISPECIES: SDR family oxidoreductase [unclassified Paracoccus (in: a-proteobacteria)]|uniref:SDR family oxidoreductase n=1 Tax=unclassified Paracoccus (in: a-proteobacteria) TaxID=2688777 RepID=UPI0012B2E335|nr:MULTISPECIES: SDR family oxidoreductase [unclassified Paracoccus (in: a-proteobacteria)]UXU75489.1 SDR family oxidoreductase [Paracoccus sp. SMMA_5]UXU81394.1 SDR family oxidoreductase [Paracoccus sp. SMMA_5_TC]
MRALILGHGYTAGFLTPMLRARGWQVIGTTRSAPRRVAEAGAEPVLWPGDEARLRDEIGRAQVILASAAPGPQGDPVLAAFGADLARARPRWLGYLSTTGVYGDHGGGWVDETTPLTPGTARGRERVAAEAAWRQLAESHDLPLHIFRLAGIYGPGRGPFAKLLAGTARRIVKPGQVFSRIHAEDIAQVLMASIAAPSPGAVYNVCDDDPAPPEAVIAHAAQLLGLPLPPAEDHDQAEMTPMARSFYAESKRVANDRIKRDLGVTLRYPDFRAGLAALARAEGLAP